MLPTDFRNRPIRWLIASGIVLAYILALVLLYPIFRESMIALAIVPVAVIAWLGGMRLGLLAGLLSFPFNTLLLNIVETRSDPWAIVIQKGGLESLAIVLIGVFIGYLHDQRIQMEQELAYREKITKDLSESEQRYRTLLESAQRQAQEAALLDQVRQALASEVELPVIFRTVVEGIAQTFGYTLVSIYLIDGDILVLQHQVGYDHVINHIPVTDGVSGRVVRSQQPLLLEDARMDSAFLGAIDGITSEVCVPLFDQSSKVVGVLNVESTGGIQLYEADLHLMSALGQQISIALGRARLYSEIRESEQRFRQLAENTEQVFWLEDVESSRMFYVSPAYETVWGRSGQSLYQQPHSWFDAVHIDDRARVFMAQSERASGRYNIEYRVVRHDGSVRWVWSRAFPIHDERGQIYRIARIAEDITDRKLAEEALRQSEERFRLMAWATKDTVWDWNLLTNQIWWGEGLQKVFHYSAELTQTNSEWWFERIHPEDQTKVHRTIDKALTDGMEFWSKEYRFQRKDGTFADIMDRGYILHDGQGKPYRMIGAMLDITERKFMESMLIKNNEQMAQFLKELQHRNIEIALLNEMSRLLQACQSPDEAHGIIADLSVQLFPATSGALYLLNTSHTVAQIASTWGEMPAIEQTFAPNECWALRHGQTRPLGQDSGGLPCLHLSEPLPAISYCVPVHVQAEILGILHVRSQDEEQLPESKRQLAYTVAEQSGMALANLNLRAALREQSIRDSLTGLFNRRYMEEALRQQISRITRHLHPLGIIMIDIDHFKDFNDIYGHAVGDLLLRELGKFLQSHIRGEDIACRYGGEEFILILPDVSLNTAQMRAEQLCQSIRELRVEAEDHTYAGITLSLGVAIYPHHGRNIERVLRMADAALYRAKQEGRDRVVVAE